MHFDLILLFIVMVLFLQDRPY